MYNTIKGFDFTPILGWSASRYDMFTICKRKYYYTYYGKYDPVFSRKEIEFLKNMTTIPLESGNIVHDINKVLFERLQKTDKEIDMKRFFDYARRKTEEYCNSKIFAETYYGYINKLDIDDIFNKVKICLNNFLTSDRFNWLLSNAIQNRNSWVIEPPGYGETRIDGMKAYFKVDFLFPVNNNFFIIDWKTGKPDNDKHIKQLIGYVLWASFHFNKNPAEIFPIIAYLYPGYKEVQIDINNYNIQEFSKQIKAETEEMYEFCNNIRENIPKDKTIFIKTQNKVFCEYCNFRKLCK